MLCCTAGILRDSQLQFGNRRREFLFRHIAACEGIVAALPAGPQRNQLAIFSEGRVIVTPAVINIRQRLAYRWLGGRHVLGSVQFSEGFVKALLPPKHLSQAAVDLPNLRLEPKRFAEETD